MLRADAGLGLIEGDWDAVGCVALENLGFCRFEDGGGWVAGYRDMGLGSREET